MLDFQYQQENSNSFANKISDCGLARGSQRRLYMLYIACMLTCSYLLSSFIYFKCLLFLLLFYVLSQLFAVLPLHLQIMRNLDFKLGMPKNNNKRENNLPDLFKTCGDFYIYTYIRGNIGKSRQQPQELSTLIFCLPYSCTFSWLLWCDISVLRQLSSGLYI